MAGAVGIGPTIKVLETLVIPFHHAPLMEEPCSLNAVLIIADTTTKENF